MLKNKTHSKPNLWYLNFYEKTVRVLGEQSGEEKREAREIESIWHWSFESTKNKRTLNVLFGFFLFFRCGVAGIAGVCVVEMDGMEIVHKDLSLKQWKQANNHGFVFVWIANSIMQPSLSFSLHLSVVLPFFLFHFDHNSVSAEEILIICKTFK